MRTGVDSRFAFKGHTRLVGGVALFAFFAVFFVAPVWAAMTACAMPCCHHGSATDPAVSAGMPGCATQCSISAPDPARTAARVVVPPNDGSVTAIASPVTVVSDVVVAPARQLWIAHAPPPRGADARIHVLNATFRI